MKKRILFLDDNEERIRGVLLRIPFDVEVVVVRDASTCIDAIIGMDPDVLFLDHDLGGEEMVEEDEHGNTGTAVVRFLVDHGANYPSIKRIILHSLNTPARINMKGSLDSTGRYEVWDAPFTAWDWQRFDGAWKNLK